MLENKRIFYLSLFLCIFVFSGNSFALNYTGEANVAHHVQAGADTYEYFVVLEGAPSLKTIKLKGFQFKAIPEVRDFYELTGGVGGVTYFEIDNTKGKMKKWAKKAGRKAEKQDFSTEEDKQAFIDEYVHEKGEAQLFKLVFKDMDGEKFKGKFSLVDFNNPRGEGGGQVASVPEPTTLLLLGTGLLGVAAFRRRFK